MRKRRNTIVEREGINFVRSVVEGANCIFHEIHKENDFGNDGIIEFVENEIVIGKSVAVQIKSGASYCSKNTCTIPADKEHFVYWSRHSLTVLGIVYDPEERCAYWINISEYINNDHNLITSGPYSITFQKSDVYRFNKEAFERVFLPLFLRKPLQLDQETAIQWSLDADSEKHSLGIGTLLYLYRNDEKTWEVFFEILHKRPTEETDPYLVYIFSLIPGHPDIYWHKNNRIEPWLEETIRRRIKRFGLTEVIKLLSFVDDNGVGRGTVGQGVEAIISILPDRDELLKGVVSTVEAEYQIRSSALLLIAYYQKRRCQPYIRSVIEGYPELRSFASEILSHIQQLGFISLY